MVCGMCMCQTSINLCCWPATSMCLRTAVKAMDNTATDCSQDQLQDVYPLIWCIIFLNAYHTHPIVFPWSWDETQNGCILRAFKNGKSLPSFCIDRLQGCLLVTNVPLKYSLVFSSVMKDRYGWVQSVYLLHLSSLYFMLHHAQWDCSITDNIWSKSNGNK